jgi:hypothetical protein
LACPLCPGQSPGDPNPELEYLQDGVRLTLIDEHPNIVTPTGIDVDHAGRIWAVASHTHFRPEDYQGPPHDEVIVLGDSSPRSVFYDRTDATMDLELSPEFHRDGWVYLAERDRILRVRDSDHDGQGDQEQQLAVLETEADYPHNGLSGLAWHPDGDLIFALGENYWKAWTLTGADGATVTGTGEGGVFRCQPDGTALRRIARGFWNPFGICVRSDGTMFAAENDPGARPPCRLLHVVAGGDYGYQRRYGDAPFHPFVSWDGQLRGTLPMLHSLGEAPCGIAPLGRGLIVPSWTDHRIDFYPLSEAGASFTTQRVTLIRGGASFRPTCIAQQTPTVFYLTDWVLGSYQLHGRGRVWRLEVDPSAAGWLGDLDLPPANAAAETAEELRDGGVGFSDPQLFELARSDDPFLRLAAIDALAQRSAAYDRDAADRLGREDRISLLLAIRKSRPADVGWARYFWDQTDTEFRFETLRWIAEAGLHDFAADVQALLERADTDYQIFEAGLAAANALADLPHLGIADPPMLIAQVTNAEASPRTRAFALRLLDPDHPGFSAELWQSLYQSREPLLMVELTRALSAQGSPAARDLLLRIASDETIQIATRSDAVAGLAGGGGEFAERLIPWVGSAEQVLREEALRALRFAPLTGEQRVRLAKLAEPFPQSDDLVRAVLDPESIRASRPPVTDLQAWQERLDAVAMPPDTDAGRRIFHHAQVGMCSKCHRHFGRGTAVGPDLSAASNVGDPQRLLRALLQPSLEVDPQYFPRTLISEDGQVFTGIMLRDGGGGQEYYRDSSGRERMFLTSQIVQRKELSTSMMPDGLVDAMTDREVRDLLAFLETSDTSRTSIQATAAGDRFVGDWWLEFADGYGGWLAVRKSDGGWEADLLWRVGSPRAVSRVELQDGQLLLERQGQQDSSQLIARLSADVAGGEQISVQLLGADQSASGQRCPPLPPRPNLDDVRFGPPIELFNGRDLSGWQLQPPTARNGWRAADGELINETPKVDFSSYGQFGNLRTQQVFADCRVHIEFNVESRRNSGVYVRGLYEAQVVDRDSPMQGINGPGAIFGRIAPTRNAGLPGGQWQTYDITLVDRHITVELNGQKVIDNQPLLGCTGGALLGDVTADGPVYLQGDHTSVRYRNIRLQPRIMTGNAAE